MNNKINKIIQLVVLLLVAVPLAAQGVADAAQLKVVYSKEEPKKSGVIDSESGKTVPGSLSFVPSVMGLIMAGEIVNDIIIRNN
jgi:tRNA A37 threonylcarbamoyladenosine dehydratase